MIKVSVMYPNSPEGTFDIEYYCNTHIPMVGGLLLICISLVFIALSIIKGIISFLILSGPLFLIGVLFLIGEKIINSK